MLLLIIRHAIAEDKDTFAATNDNDDLRPLTQEGIDKMAVGAAGLRAIVPELSHLATSPLVRAQQTADIVARAYGRSIDETAETLRPVASPESFVKWLSGHGKNDVVAVVGHEPHLTGLTTWLTCGERDSRVDLKKGAGCLL